MCPFKSVPLVKEHLARPGHPFDPEIAIILEEESALECHTSGEFQRRRIQNQEIDRGRQQNVKRIRRCGPEICSHIHVGIGPTLSACLGTEDQCEASACFTQDLFNRPQVHGHIMTRESVEEQR